MGWDSYEKAAERGPMSLFFKVLGPLLVVIIVIGVVGFVFNPFRQAARVIEKTMDADNVLYNYEWFKQRNQDVKALNAKVKSTDAMTRQFKEEAGPRENWHRQDRDEYSRLSAILLGLKQQRNDLVAEYNARSEMANRAIFKTGDLPKTISIEGELR